MTILGDPPIKHVYREANMVADWVAKSVNCFCNDLVIFEQPPSGVAMN